MAQASVGKRDLRNAMLRTPRFPVGMRHMSDVIRISTRMCHIDADPAIFGNKIDLVLDKIDLSFERDFKRYFDDSGPFECEDFFIAGSQSEGLALAPTGDANLPDYDFMCILKNLSFSEKDQECGNLTVKEDTAFVNASLSDENMIDTWNDFLEDEPDGSEKRQLSSQKLKLKLHGNYRRAGNFFAERVLEESEELGDGPSLEMSMVAPDHGDEWKPFGLKISKKRCSCDFVLAIRCDGWPLTAREWLLRDRVWPDKELVRKIYKGGFYIVAKRSKEGNFRLSFSNAETTLVENFSPLQHKVARAFKAIIKYYQCEWSRNIEKIICSYHLKTLLFWHAEKFTEDSWAEDDLVKHLFVLLDELAHALKTHFLPMYFLPKCNLLGEVEDLEEMEKISEKIVELSKNVPAIITAIDELANFGKVDTESLIKRCESFVKEMLFNARLGVKEFTQSFRNYIETFCCEHIDTWMHLKVDEDDSNEESAQSEAGKKIRKKETVQNIEKLAIREDILKAVYELIEDKELMQKLTNLFSSATVGM